MPSKEIAALDKSIAHWERNVTADNPKEVFVSSSDCECCRQFYENRSRSCAKCPIAKFTGKNFCMNTPYSDADRAYFLWSRGYNNKEDFQIAAQAEVAFLKKVRDFYITKEKEEKE